MSATSFEQALEQYGDDLYRLAVLLSPDQAAANALLVRTARQFRNHAAADVRLGCDGAVRAIACAERGLFRRRGAFLPG
jgi:hypothetical protein